MTLRTRIFLPVFGLLALGASVGLARHDAAASADRTWPPFVLVAGLLLIGAVAYEDGTFRAAGALLDRLPGGEPLLYVVAMGLVAAVTVVLNLDTSVAFLTPVLVGAARRRGANEERLLYGCVFLSNAASLLLPGSNLTNLLVLSGTHVSGSAFLRSMALPWAAAVVVTVAGVALVFRRPAAGGHRPDGSGARATTLSVLSIGAAAVAVLTLPDPAVPVLGVGLAAAATRLAQRRIDPERIARAVDVASLGAVFGVATALGSLARAWTFPGHVMRTAGSGQTAVLGAVSSVLANNLPAAVLLGSARPAHPRSLLFGLNIGPNLAVTGSLSALVWWQAARSVGARPSSPSAASRQPWRCRPLARLGENRAYARENGPASALGDVTDPDRHGLPILAFASKAAWKAWLAANHGTSQGLWLKIAKAGSGNDSVTYAEALDVALCHGWIDGQKGAYDEAWWLQRFTPRGPRSKWSRINCGKAEALITSGEMQPAGLAEVEAAKADGRWAEAYESQRTATIPDDLAAALDANPEAAAFFKTLKSASRYAILYRIGDAKRPATRAQRIDKFVEMLARGEAPHLFGGAAPAPGSRRRPTGG